VINLIFSNLEVSEKLLGFLVWRGIKPKTGEKEALNQKTPIITDRGFPGIRN